MAHQFATAVPVRSGHGLNRDAIRDFVVSKFTADNFPVLSSIIADENTMTEAERSKMKLTRLNAKMTQAGISASEAAAQLVSPPTSTAKDGSAQQQQDIFSQAELVQVIESMDQEIHRQWGVGDRVKALRIAIQGSKLVGQSKVPAAYPSVFILVATVLDTFGNLVADRVQSTACHHSSVVANLVAQGRSLVDTVIPEQAVEMCNNWFLKILSIRELLPRIYVELALVKCYKYVAKKVRTPLVDVFSRLARQIRGVADPLVAAHLRWYLFLRAGDVFGKEGNWAECFLPTMHDAIETLRLMPDAWYTRENITPGQYLSYFGPALQWQFECMAAYARPSFDAFADQVLAAIESVDSPHLHNGTLLNVLISSASAPFLHARLDRILALIESVDVSATTGIELVGSLMHNLCQKDSPVLQMTKSSRRELLQKVYDITVKNANASSHLTFLDTCRSMTLFCALFMQHTQVSMLLGIVRSNLHNTAEEEKPLFVLLNMLVQLLNFAQLVAGDHFLPLLQSLSNHHRREVIVAMFDSVEQIPSTHCHGALELCRVLHDTLGDMPSEADTQRTAITIARVLRSIKHADTDSHLRFLCEARQTLSRLDEVKVFVVDNALDLACSLAEQPRKRNVAKAAFAYCHCTIPGIYDIFTRLRTALRAATVSFEKRFVAQGESLLQYCVSSLNEVKPFKSSVGPMGEKIVNNSDPELVGFLKEFIALGVALPPLESGAYLQALGAVLDWSDQYEWPEWSSGRHAVASQVIQVTQRCAIEVKKPHGDRTGLNPTQRELMKLARADCFCRDVRRICRRALKILRPAESGGGAAIATVEGCIPLIALNPPNKTAARLAHRVLKLLRNGHFEEDEKRADFLRQKTAVEDLGQNVLGEQWNDIVDGTGAAELCEVSEEEPESEVENHSVAEDDEAVQEELHQDPNAAHSVKQEQQATDEN